MQRRPELDFFLLNIVAPALFVAFCIFSTHAAALYLNVPPTVSNHCIRREKQTVKHYRNGGVRDHWVTRAWFYSSKHYSGAEHQQAGSLDGRESILVNLFTSNFQTRC